MLQPDAELGVTKKSFRPLMALTPWLSLAAPFVLLAILSALRYLSPGLFCVAVTSGGKEFVCGGDYSHVSIGILRLSGFLAWMLLLAAGGVEVFRGRGIRAAVIAWLISVLLLTSWVILWLNQPVECSP